MQVRNVTLCSLVLAVVIAVLPPYNPVTAGGFDWAQAIEETTLASTSNDATGDYPEVKQKKSQNGFMRALGAPFRAIGRLFGGGKKNEQHARRISDKEAAKFETSKITRIKDASISLPDSTQAEPITAPASEFDMHLQQGRQFLIAGNLDSAIAELTIAISINPKSAEVNKLLGIAYENKGFRDSALRAFEAALKSDENNAEHLNNFGFLLYKNGDYQRATKYLKRAVKISPNDARIWNNLALVQCQRGKFEDAFLSFIKAGGEYNAHMNMAAQLQGQAYAKEAIKHLEQAQAMRPNSVDVLTKLVALYELTGRPTDAENVRRSLLALKTFADANK